MRSNWASDDSGVTKTRFLALCRTVSEIWPVIGSKFSYTLSFRALDCGDPYGIFGKALHILKLESLEQPT